MSKLAAGQLTITIEDVWCLAFSSGKSGVTSPMAWRQAVNDVVPTFVQMSRQDLIKNLTRYGLWYALGYGWDTDRDWARCTWEVTYLEQFHVQLLCPNHSVFEISIYMYVLLLIFLPIFIFTYMNT